jgi:hypothetical protein
MLEKAGLNPLLSQALVFTTVKCAENVARWWLMEHLERRERDDLVSFPGDTAMLRAMLPAAIWLGKREYSGIWTFGGRNRFRDLEVFGALGDGRANAVFDALAVYGQVGQSLPSWRPFWYRDGFTDWAREILQRSNVPDLLRHDPESRVHWCGLRCCPYPYVMSGTTLEEPTPDPFVTRSLFPWWGAHLRGGDPPWEEMEREEPDTGMQGNE